MIFHVSRSKADLETTDDSLLLPTRVAMARRAVREKEALLETGEYSGEMLKFLAIMCSRGCI